MFCQPVLFPFIQFINFAVLCRVLMGWMNLTICTKKFYLGNPWLLWESKGQTLWLPMSATEVESGWLSPSVSMAAACTLSAFRFIVFSLSPSLPSLSLLKSLFLPSGLIVFFFFIFPLYDHAVCRWYAVHWHRCNCSSELTYFPPNFSAARFSKPYKKLKCY